jgi:hypothetical protein
MQTSPRNPANTKDCGDQGNSNPTTGLFDAVAVVVVAKYLNQQKLQRLKELQQLEKLW